MDTKKELAKIAAKAKEKQREHGGTAQGRTLCQISDEVIDTKKELAKIAAKAKENQRLSEGAGNKGMQISDNLKIDTREELAKIAGALRSYSYYYIM